MKTFKIFHADRSYNRIAISHEDAKQEFMKEFGLHWSEITCIIQLSR